MNFEVPLVTDMTPVDPPPGAAGGAPGSKRFWHGNDDEHPEVSSLQRHSSTLSQCFVTAVAKIACAWLGIR